ncbi:MAG: chromosome segregation protein SMC [Ruminococcaceae bacterium]|nr:chromosome segregation protein SMC [Oscillospiraceae bacterium]
MYLKSLEMQGFKSFPDKTKLHFERGTTVIVGPNGSGKSNISDAMRWVLGEISSKSLRGTKMEDIIFGGADSRRPMGFAEVSVTFDNTDPEGRLECPYDEVTVTRRYYRAGESEYFINRRACRLRDVQELFMNTGVGRDGYSIIGQGKIAEIISRKSDERRSIFEDASGIAKYRHRKNDTERKLKTTEENMTRVSDVFHEVEMQVEPLEKEAERAKKALELHETKKRVDVQLWLFDSERLHREIETAKENYRNTGYDLQIAEAAIADFEAQSEQLYEEAQQNNASAAALIEQINALDKENHERDNQYHVADTKIAGAKDKIEAAERSIATKEQQLSRETEEGARHAGSLAALREQCEALAKEEAEKTAEADALAARAEKLADDVAVAFADVSEWEKEAVNMRVRMQVLENSKVTDRDKNESITTEMAEYQAVSDRLAASLAEKEKAAASYEEELQAADGRLAEFDSRIGALDEQLAAIDAREKDMRMQSDLAEQRLSAFRAMEQHFEGYNNSVRFVMEAYQSGRITDASGNRCGRIYGPLSKVISVDRAYVTALEVALGANLQNIVVEDESVAKAAIYALKKAEAGRATFFPISSMQGSKPTPEMRDAEKCPGYVGVAADLARSEDKFRAIISSLLGRTLVFDTLDHANDMARRTGFRVRVVTLDGQVINAGGSFSGGSMKQKGSVLSRAGEIEALGERLKQLAASLAACEKERAALESEREDLALDRADVESRRALLSALQSGEQADAAQLRAKLDANDALIERLQADFDALNRQRAGYDEELERLAAEEKALRHRIKEMSALRTDKDVERNGVLDDEAALRRELTELYIAISNLRKDMETAEHYIAEAEARAEAIRLEIAEERGRIAAFEEDIRTETLRKEANRNTFVEGERVLAELREQQMRLNTGNMNIEKKRADVSEKLRTKNAEKETILRAHTKNETRLNALYEEQDKLVNKFHEDYEMTRNDALALGYPAITAAEREETVALQTKCRNSLRAMGNVDLDAVEKYKEIKERYDYMKGQIADMSAARDDLLKIIRDLETEMRTSFIATFEKINEKFNQTFSELFGGGSAELSLSDPDDVLTSGIEIKAAPPGKIIKNLVQLSGGEQSFIAIALFFAILQVNPTPFFILDEIEAALDEVNVARFAAYIKRYSLDTQFILITHRRGTMEAANRLYGVTMPERGISKVLALDVASISGKQEGDDWNGIFS